MRTTVPPKSAICFPATFKRKLVSFTQKRPCRPLRGRPSVTCQLTIRFSTLNPLENYYYFLTVGYAVRYYETARNGLITFCFGRIKIIRDGSNCPSDTINESQGFHRWARFFHILSRSSLVTQIIHIDCRYFLNNNLIKKKIKRIN